MATDLERKKQIVMNVESYFDKEIDILIEQKGKILDV